MKVLTAAQMREVDRRTIERGIPGIILMENAGMRVVEFLRETFAPLEHHRVAIFCGKGNNGGDGFVIARQLYQRKLCGELTVIEVFPRDLLTGDAAQARTALAASGCPVVSEIPDSVFDATIVVDAVLGTGIKGAVSGRAAEVIEVMNSRFPHAAKVAVDIPSGLPSDQIKPEGNYFRTNYTVTFTALKSSQALSPSYEFMGKLVVHPIGSPDDLCATNRDYTLHITTPADLGHLFSRARGIPIRGCMAMFWLWADPLENRALPPCPAWQFCESARDSLPLLPRPVRSLASAALRRS